VVCLRQLLRLGDIVRRFNPERLYTLAGPHYFGRNNLERGGADPDARYPEEGVETAVSIYESVYQECVDGGLRASAISASNLLAKLKRRATRKEIVELVEELSRRVGDELLGEFFLQLTLVEAEAYENWQKGWETILEKFRDPTRDVEEMNKCFALGRYTASMFHALHVAEWGAVYLGDRIGVTDPKKSWGATERKLRELVKSGHGAFPSTLGCTFEFVEQMHREIESMMLAWRHKVDHAVNHLYIVPNTDFTPDVAEHVISAVRIFMLRLLEGLP
jgi:hypothetical protein